MAFIDTHVHLNDYDGLTRTVDTALSLQERLDALIDNMNNNNICYSILISSYKVDENRPSTSELINIINKNNLLNRIGIVAGFSIDNHNDKDLKDYRQWLKDKIIKGIKLYCGYEHYYPYDKRYQLLYDMCVEFDCPVMIHTGDAYSQKAKVKYSHPLNIDDIAVDNPDLKIIMCHIGNPWIIDCQEVVYKNKNVYADISGLTVGSFTSSGQKHYAEKIKEMLNYLDDPHRLLYGSDWPISNMKSYIDFVKRIEFEDVDSFNLLMYKNAESLFNISL